MSDEIIDRAIYSDLQATTGADFAAELLDTFLEEAPGMLAELRRTRSEGQLVRYRRAAHSLKSNANTFGAVRLATLAREIELKGLSIEPLIDDAALAALETAFAEAALQLKALTNG